MNKWLEKHIKYSNVYRDEYGIVEYKAKLLGIKLYYWSYGVFSEVTCLGKLLGFREGYEK